MSYTVIENEKVIDNVEFNSIYEKTIFIILLRFEKDGRAYPSLNKLSKLALISKPTAIKAIKGLEEQEKIIKMKEKSKGDYDNNSYTINSKYLNEGSKEHLLPSKGDLPPSKADLPQVVKDVDNGVVKEVYSTNTNKTNTNKQYIYYADNVKMTGEEYNKLIEHYGKLVVDDLILDLDNYIVNGKGKKYKDHYKVLNTWARKKNYFCKNNTYNRNNDVAPL